MALRPNILQTTYFRRRGRGGAGAHSRLQNRHTEGPDVGSGVLIGVVRGTGGAVVGASAAALLSCRWRISTMQSTFEHLTHQSILVVSRTRYAEIRQLDFVLQDVLRLVVASY